MFLIIDNTEIGQVSDSNHSFFMLFCPEGIKAAHTSFLTMSLVDDVVGVTVTSARELNDLLRTSSCLMIRFGNATV